VPDLASVKITAVGPTSGTALNSRFIMQELLLTVTGSGGTGGSANAAAKVTQSGIDGSNHPFFTFDSVAGESYEIQCSTDLLSWTPLATLSGTGASVTFNDEFTQATSEPKKFYRAKTVLTPNGNLTNTTLSITHDMASVRKIADNVGMLYRGRLIWHGDVHRIDDSGNPYLDQFVHGRSHGPITTATR
jgi:hypothetical protein